MKASIQHKLGARLKELRTKLKMTQEDLAFASGIEYKYIQRIEGKTPPAIRIDTVERLAKALNTTPSDLLDF